MRTGAVLASNVRVQSFPIISSLVVTPGRTVSQRRNLLLPSVSDSLFPARRGVCSVLINQVGAPASFAVSPSVVPVALEVMHNELDIKSLWKELDEYEKELDNETKSLQEVWVKIAQLKGTNETTLTE
jgi:hypothetical protein